MKSISDANYNLAVRLILALSKTQGKTIREKENARKAALLYKKLSKNATRQTIQVNPQSTRVSVGEIFPADGLD